MLWGEAQGSPQPCSMFNRIIGVRHRHPQGMAGKGYALATPSKPGDSSIYAWIGSVEKMLCENEGILGENTPICLNKHGRVFSPSCLRGPKGMVRVLPVWQQIWGHAFRKGGMSHKKKGHDSKRGSTERQQRQLLPHLCVFTATSQVGRRCEGHTAGLFSQLFPWPARCK